MLRPTKADTALAMGSCLCRGMPPASVDTLRGPAEALTGHGSIGVKGFPAPGTFVLAGFLMLIFVVYYFINYGYLASVWKFS